MRGMGSGMAEGELAVYKHLLAIKERREAYKGMSPEDSKKLLEYVQMIDQHTHVSLDAPSQAMVNGEVEVIAQFEGGSGPVIGLMLLDNNLRWESRSLAADGWLILDAPKVIGPDGKTQMKFLDHRTKGLAKNLSYVIVDGIAADLEKKTFSSGSVTWRLKAPRDPGTYTLAIAILYGTEKATVLGRGQTMEGIGQLPRGGFEGHSGRILFSGVQTIRVH